MLSDLLDALADFYSARAAADQNPMFTDVAAALRGDAGEAPADRAAAPPPVVRWLDRLEPPDDPAITRIVDAFRTIAPTVPWAQTAAYLDAMPPGTADDYGYVKVLGPDALAPATDVAVGIGIWGPGLHYPSHHHAAEEAYHVLAGHPEFRSSGGEWRGLEINEAFHQLPWAPHEQRFGDRPCLLMWAWRGSVTDPASLVDG